MKERRWRLRSAGVSPALRGGRPWGEIVRKVWRSR